MFDIASFGLGDMIECGAALRRLGNDAASIEDACGNIVRYLHDNLVDKSTGARACALVRAYMSQSFGDLSLDQADFARQLARSDLLPRAKCLTLLASSGDQPEWNDPAFSLRHRAIPLVDQESVAGSPMVAQLISQLGIELDSIIDPHPDVVLDLARSTSNVFHVADAEGSPWVPDQDEFVARYAIRSVLGFGGVLPPGDMFAVILFSKLPISRETADLFKTVAVNAKLALLPFAAGKA